MQFHIANCIALVFAYPKPTETMVKALLKRQICSMYYLNFGEPVVFFHYRV